MPNRLTPIGRKAVANARANWHTLSLYTLTVSLCCPGAHHRDTFERHSECSSKLNTPTPLNIYWTNIWT